MRVEYKSWPNSGPLDGIVSWRKACSCDSRSSIGSYHMRTDPEEDGFVTRVTLYPGPVCDECGIPWEPANVERNRPAAGFPDDGPVDGRVGPRSDK